MNIEELYTLINSNMNNPKFYLILGGILLIILLLKGFALYRSARKESKIWFWVLLIVNTFGILPLLYLIFSKKETKEE